MAAGTEPEAARRGNPRGRDGDFSQVAWAVGWTNKYNSVILRWTGTAWTRVAGPALSGGARLMSVAAMPDGSAWTVGATDFSAHEQTLILHWNGVAWQRVPSPNPDGVAALAAVAASPDGPVWAVGTDIVRNRSQSPCAQLAVPGSKFAARTRRAAAVSRPWPQFRPAWPGLSAARSRAGIP